MKKYKNLILLFIVVFIVSLFGTVTASANNSLKVTSTDPINNSIKFPTTKDITVKYGSSVKLGDKQPELISQTGKNVSVQSNIFHGYLIITHPKLEPQTKYTLKIPAGACEDYSGKICDGYVLNFKTSPLSIYPRVTGSYPVKNSHSFPLKGNIKIYYNKLVKLGMTQPELVSSKGTKIPFIIHVEKNTVIISSMKLTPLTNYKLTISQGNILDISGNYCFNYVLFFKTMKKSAYIVPGDVTSNSASMHSFKYTIPYTIKNTGEIAAKNFKVLIYLTPTKSIKGTKYLIGKQVIKYLGPGKTIKINTVYIVSKKVPRNMKYYVAVVASTVSYSHIKMKIIPYNPNY